MSKKSESNSIKLERKKVSSEVLERVKLFTDALNLNFSDSEDSEDETYEEYQIRKQKELSKPKRIKVTKGYAQKFGVSLDYSEDDITEVALFKTAMNQDQKRFTHLVKHRDLHPKMKIHVLSFSVLIACGFRDIEVIDFLSKNTKNLTKLITVDNDGYEESCSPVGMVLSGYCNKSFVDRKLINLLLENGLDINLQKDGYSSYTAIINSASEEFAIEMLDYISDINAVQYDRCEYFSPDSNISPRVMLEPTYYLIQAVEVNKLKLAVAMIKKGAKTDVLNGSGYSILNLALIDQRDGIKEENLKFVEYLFKNKHVSKLATKYYEFGLDLLKFYEVAKLVVASGLETEGFREEDIIKYNQIKAMMKFEQKALTDIKAVQTAYSECNSTSVKKSFISKKTTDAMLKYYVKDYKNKCKQLIDDGHGEFLAKLAGEVIEQIKIYTMFNWPQTYDIAKAFVVNGDEIDISKEIIGEIGEYIFWLDVQDISS